MALTRKMLKAMGIDEEKIEQIIEAHSETVDALKEERDGYKADAEKLPEVQRELNEAKNKVPDGETVAKSDYDTLKKEYDDYKTEILNQQTHDAKEKAYRKLLTDTGISEKRLDAIVKVSKIDDIELTEEGKVKNAEKLSENIKTEWSDFIVTQKTKGAATADPPDGDNSEKDPFLEGFGD